MMQLSVHGGGCCGIRHIFGFGMGNSVKQKLLAKPKGDYDLKALFTEARPEETHLARLKAIIDFKDQKWPYGIIEVVLTDYAVYKNNPYDEQDKYNQVKYWRKELEKLGFKLVSKCFNSNSQNNDYVFHRCVEPPKKKSKKKTTVSLRAR